MSSEQQPPIVEADPRGDLTLNVGNPSDDPSSSRCFLVCSRTLARISPVFDRMLYGAFAESRGKHTAEAAWTVDLPEDPPFAFTIFVTISHGFVHKVPHSLSLDEQYGLTVLTHYYDVTRILAPWASRWIASLHEPNPGSPILLAKLLWISWELGRGPLFESTARRILTEAPGSLLDPDSPLHTLQMPPDIFGKLERAMSLLDKRITAIRKQTIQAMLDVFHDLAEHLVTVNEKPRLCRHASYMGPH
ncbi:hypothetical protein VD0002_g7166 [Verticillium dahliae]|uniref:BTB domain-containing protein n=1 Tax=Verticillium dahliae TaxID=27337 RepID=A0AA44WFU1_VERDA|nr:hypothetical protein BJF96_g6353 [Verticillium dahliae]PNH49236.1 hypothetical protein VD0003_g7896 [Verticillium dahliae]PNH60476.1 hypothetical protein VD0002_g7166 [Verticillium dahliae]